MSEQTKIQKRVLIVDDEPHIGKVFSIKLRLSGYNVITTTKGKEAIRLVKTYKPDVVLLDMLMPDMSGIEVLDNLRRFSSVPVILMSARPGIEELGTRYGANDSLAKPFDPDRLVEKIEFVLKREEATTLH